MLPDGRPVMTSPLPTTAYMGASSDSNLVPLPCWCIRGLKTLTSSLIFSLKPLAQFIFQLSHSLLQAVSQTHSLLSPCHYLSPSRHHFPPGHPIILLPSLPPFLSICHTGINFQYELNSTTSLLRIFKGIHHDL